MYRIVLTKSAQKEYAYLYKNDRSIFEHIHAALKFISENPHEGKPLKFTLKGKWSYRVGAYRIIYAIQHNILTVYVLDIGHRREVYK